MSWWQSIISNLPEVAGPTQKRLSFKEKLKWTGIVLFLFFILGWVPLFGLGQNALQQFEYLSIILGAKFGSIISLGIGPIVTASIVLQLLNGSGIVKFDLTSTDGKKNFQGVQKLLSILFVLFEAAIYVFMGGLAPDPALAGTAIFFQIELLLVFQLFLGGILIMFMDEIVSKWGFGSGISLFIAAGVSEEIFVKALNPLSINPADPVPIGAIPALFYSLANGDPITAFLKLATVLSTVLVFVFAVYAQAMKVEIPLSFGRVRGYGMRWPLHFIYTSNIPVILVAALMANVQLWARLLQRGTDACRQTLMDGGTCSIAKGLLTHFSNFMGTFTGNTPSTGLVAWMNSPDMLNKIITKSVTPIDIAHATAYVLFMVVGSVIFSIFWVQTAGMDAKSQAKQMVAYGLQIPGFRKDERILEHLLNRYIWPLTIMGAITVGTLAAFADLGGALSRGTGILLTVMIVYRLYEDIAKQHMMDMHPMMRKMME